MFNTRKEIARIDDQLKRLWRDSSKNDVDYGPEMVGPLGSIYQKAPVNEVIQLILDHLGLRIGDKPSTYELVKKEDKQEVKEDNVVLS